MSRFTDDFPAGLPVRPAGDGGGSLDMFQARAVQRIYGDFEALRSHYDGITAALRSAVPGDPKGWVDKVATLVESRDRFRGEAQAAQKMRECEGPEPCGECLKCLSAELRVVKQERDTAQAKEEHSLRLAQENANRAYKAEDRAHEWAQKAEGLVRERDEARALLAVANRGTPPAEPAAVTAPAVDPGEGYVLLDAKDVILATDEYSHGHEIPGRPRGWHPIPPNDIVRTHGPRNVESMQDEYDEPTYYRRRVDCDVKPQNVPMEEMKKDARLIFATRSPPVEVHTVPEGAHVTVPPVVEVMAEARAENLAALRSASGQLGTQCCERDFDHDGECPWHPRRSVPQYEAGAKVPAQLGARVVSAAQRAVDETHRMMRGHERADRAEQKVLVLERLLDAMTREKTGWTVADVTDLLAYEPGAVMHRDEVAAELGISSLAASFLLHQAKDRGLVERVAGSSAWKLKEVRRG